LLPIQTHLYGGVALKLIEDVPDVAHDHRQVDELAIVVLLLLLLINSGLLSLVRILHISHVYKARNVV